MTTCARGGGTIRARRSTSCSRLNRTARVPSDHSRLRWKMMRPSSCWPEKRLAQGRLAGIPAQPLQALAVVGVYARAGVQIKAPASPRAPSASREAGEAVFHQASHTRPARVGQCGPVLAGGGRPGRQGSVLGQISRLGRAVWVEVGEAAMDASDDPANNRPRVPGCRRGDGDEAGRPLLAALEGAVQDDGMEVNVEGQPISKALG